MIPHLIVICKNQILALFVLKIFGSYKFVIKSFLCFIALGVVFSSCQKEEIEAEQKMRLDRKLEFYSKTSVIPNRTWQYQYDDNYRINKIIENNHKETLFFYDDENNLVNKKTFYPESNQYLDSTVYRYSNGKLQEEINYSLISEDILPNRIEYEYDGLNLILKIESRYTTRYEYDDGLCVKETVSIGNRDNRYVIHQYSGNNLVLSSYFTIQSESGYLIQQIYYTYDENENLILEESIQKMEELSADLDYIYVYKYEPY